MSSLIQESGLADGLFEIVRGGPEIGRDVIAQPEVRKVIFFGSFESGGKVAEICGRHFKPCLLELGGGSAAIVCEEADLSWTAKGIAWSAFSAAGRSCVGTKQVFVHSSIKKMFVSLLLEEMKALRLGEALDPAVEMASSTPSKSLAKLKEIVLDALNKDAQVWTQRGRVNDVSSSALDGPIVLLNLAPEMRAAWPGEEIEAPVLCIREVASVDQAIDEANAYLSGLGASVWSNNLRKARAIARRIKAGLIWVNDSSVGLPQFPWGGMNRSGWGRLFSEVGLTELASVKVISTEKRPGGRRKFWWFPYSREKHSAFLALNELLYGRRRAKKIFSLIASLIKNFLQTRRS
jgi:acyl-CoA reductase-like NAD-dependent aldehyde dehydrogenase